MDHADAKRVHFNQAMQERYGIECTPLVEEHILWQIRNGVAEKLHEKLNGTIQYRVTLGGSTKVIVVYDPVDGDLVTALTSGMYKSKRIHNKKKKNPKRNKKTNWEM